MNTALPPSLAFGRLDAANEQVQVHLMPFQVDYTGPAPVSTFLMLSPAEASKVEDEQVSSSGKDAEPLTEDVPPLPQYTAAFRGRQMHATPLLLPPGWSGGVYEVPPPPAADAVVAPPPAPAGPKPAPVMVVKPSKGPKRFSLDSDSDESDSEPEPEAAPDAPVAGDVTAGGLLLSDKFIDEDESFVQTPMRAAQTLRPLAGLAQLPNDPRSALLVWAPDGPADVGDDRFFRTLGEWQSVVINTLHSH